ncbi:MAG TPA: hypothetical protein VFG83_01415 [Kofleriaceae bacterium]|nr:hypothetical protein [Kofleriaceae bacterium]
MTRVFVAMTAIIAVASFSAPARADETTDEPAVDYGVGLRLRQVYVPEALIELFVEDASSGVSHTGFGGEVIRRHGNFELSLGIEYEHINPDDGLWLEKGDTPGEPGESPDFVEFDGFGWVDADVTFAWHKPINDVLAFRYGAGFGLGIIFGDVLQTDTLCQPGGNINSCDPVESGAQGQYKDNADLPPVFPVINLLAGLQLRPVENLTIDIEVGLRSVAYAGTTVAYYF